MRWSDGAIEAFLREIVAGPWPFHSVPVPVPVPDEPCAPRAESGTGTGTELRVRCNLYGYAPTEPRN